MTTENKITPDLVKELYNKYEFPSNRLEHLWAEEQLEDIAPEIAKAYLELHKEFEKYRKESCQTAFDAGMMLGKCHNEKDMLIKSLQEAAIMADDYYAPYLIRDFIIEKLEEVKKS